MWNSPFPRHFFSAQPTAKSCPSSAHALACSIGRIAAVLPVVTFVMVTAGPGFGPYFGWSSPFGESPAYSLSSASCAGAGWGRPFRS